LLGGIEFAKWINIDKWRIDYAARYAQEDCNLNQRAVGTSHNQVGRKNAGPSTGSRPQQGTSTGGTTYTGVGEPMQIDRQRQKKKFKCFNCGKFGHISRDCNKHGLQQKRPTRSGQWKWTHNHQQRNTEACPRKGKKKKHLSELFFKT